MADNASDTEQASRGFVRHKSGINLETMRQEAVKREQAADNWMMASLLAVNGGGIYALMGLELTGVAYAISLVMFIFGITAGLVAGRYTSILASHQSNMMLATIKVEQASRHLERVLRIEQLSQLDSAEQGIVAAESEYGEAVKKYEQVFTSDMPLALGIVFFLFGCIAAGIAML